MWTVRPIDFINNQSLVTLKTLDADATAEYSSATAYSIGDVRKVTGTGGGAAIATYKIYECIQAGTGNDPTTDVGTVSPGIGSYWKETGSVNDWAWSNGVLSDVSTKTAGNAYWKFETEQVVNAIALANITGNSVNITMTSTAEGEVYNEDIDLTSYVGIDSWYEWLFEPLVKFKKAIVFDLPPYADAVIEITIEGGGSDTSVGLIVLGQQFEIGDPLYGTQFGVDNYSTIDFVPALNRTVQTERTYSEYGRVQIQVEDYRLEFMRQEMLNMLNKTTVWIGDKTDNGTAVIGIMREMVMGLKDKNGTYMDLDIGGAS